MIFLLMKSDSNNPILPGLRFTKPYNQSFISIIPWRTIENNRKFKFWWISYKLFGFSVVQFVFKFNLYTYLLSGPGKSQDFVKQTKKICSNLWGKILLCYLILIYRIMFYCAPYKSMTASTFVEIDCTYLILIQIQFCVDNSLEEI